MGEYSRHGLVMAFDISSKAGWALLDLKGPGHAVTLRDYGRQDLGTKVQAVGQYPWSMITSAKLQAKQLHDLIDIYTWGVGRPVIIIEETNLGQNRYAQKWLEWTHLSFLEKAEKEEIYYLSSSAWRQALGLRLSAAERRQNAKLSRAKALAKAAGTSVDKKGLGIRGRIHGKHLAVRYVNQEFGLDLRVKDNDIADAICLGMAWYLGASPCDGQ